MVGTRANPDKSVPSATSGVGVLDKSMAVLEAVAAATGGSSLNDLMAATEISRATAHRLAVALEAHGLLRRDSDGRFLLGLRLVGLGHAAAARWPIAEAARPALEALRIATGESVQLYVRDGDFRVCLLSLESQHELRTIVAEGARLPLDVGSAGRLLGSSAEQTRLSGREGSTDWVASVEERAPGVASVSAAVGDGSGATVAAVGISGPVGRLGDDPGQRFGAAVLAAAAQVEAALAEGVAALG
ncbi:MAG: helix-turn-helix domain-containing protein [Aquihabitans sp.]